MIAIALARVVRPQPIRGKQNLGASRRMNMTDSLPPMTSQRTWRLNAPLTAKGHRLDAFLGQALQNEGLSREKIKAWIKAGKLLMDGAPCRKPNTLLAGGESMELQGQAPDSGLEPESGDLRILHEDEHCVVLNKPAGLTVHPAPGLNSGTLAHRLLHRYPELAEMDPQRPGIVHRIDKDTSGLLLVARNETTRLALSRAFAERQVEKHYLALVAGVPLAANGVIDAPIGRHPTKKVKMAIHKGGRPARSDYQVLHAEPNGAFSLLAVRIHSGRTHQIRAHLQHIGHPILGDSLYGPGRNACPPACREKIYATLASRQMLHAWRLGVTHPVSGEKLSFLLPPPKDFMRLALYLSRQLQRLAVTGLPGCGKSAVSQRLQQAGVPLFSADGAVAALYEPGEDGWTWLRNHYGDTYLHDCDDLAEHKRPPNKRPANKRPADNYSTENCPVDKRKLFAAMRRDDALRREVENAIHPMVRHRLDEFWRQHRHSRLALAEIPLLLEAGEQWRRQAADLLLAVYCPRNIRLRRLESSRGWGQDVLAAMEAWQWPEAVKINACDLVLDNSQDMEALERRVTGLQRVLQGLRRKRMRRLAARLRQLWSSP